MTNFELISGFFKEIFKQINNFNVYKNRIWEEIMYINKYILIYTYNLYINSHWELNLEWNRRSLSFLHREFARKYYLKFHITNIGDGLFMYLNL